MASFYEKLKLVAQYYLPGFNGIRYLVPKKKIFKMFLPHTGMVAILWLKNFDKFRSPCLMKAYEGSICNVNPDCQVASGQQLFEINEIWVTLGKSQRMTLTSGTCIHRCTYLVNYIY